MTVEEYYQVANMMSVLTLDEINLMTELAEALPYDRARAHQILINAGRRGLPEFEAP